MRRTALARLAVVAALAAAGLLVASGDAPGAAPATSIHSTAATTRSALATVDVATSEGTFITVAGDSRNSQPSPLRSYAATLAALIALVSLAAARATRTFAFRGRATSATFDARRRGPPLLHTC